MVRWLRWHCPPDTGIDTRALAVWGRARYLSVTEALHNTFTRGWGRNIFVSFKPPRPGTEPRTLAWKAAVLTTTLGPPPAMCWRKWIALSLFLSGRSFLLFSCNLSINWNAEQLIKKVLMYYKTDIKKHRCIFHSWFLFILPRYP